MKKRLGPLAFKLFESDELLKETVEKRGEKYVVLSKSGDVLGEFDTEAEALERLAQIEKAKKAKESLKAQGILLETAPLDSEGRRWKAIILQAGPSKNTVTDPDSGRPKPRFYTPEAVKAATEAQLFENRVGIAVEVPNGRELVFDHLPEDLDANMFPANSGGVFTETRFDEKVGEHGGAAVGIWTFLDENLRKRNLAFYEATGVPMIGFSINAMGEGEFTESNFEIQCITECATIDAVSKPAAGGRLVQKLAASFKDAVQKLKVREAQKEAIMKKWLKLLAAQCAILGFKSEAAAKLMESDGQELKEAEAVQLLQTLIEDPEAAQFKETLEEILKAMLAARDGGEGPAAPPAPAAASTDPAPAAEGTDPTPDPAPAPAATGMTEAEMEAWIEKREKLAESKKTVDKYIEDQATERELDEKVVKLIRESVSRKPGDLEHAKASVEQVCEALGNHGWREPQITVTREAQDKRNEYIEKALIGALNGKPVDNVKPFTSIRETVARFTGIFKPRKELRHAVMGQALRLACSKLNEHGRGYELDAREASIRESVRESQMGHLKNALARRYRVGVQESIDTTVLVELFAAVLFKRMIDKVKRLQANDWMQVISKQVELEDFRSRHEVRTGRYPLLAVVAEGAPIQPIVTPGSEEALWNAVKYANTEDWTMESNLSDDLGHQARIPEDLLDAGLETRRKNFWDILTDNTFTGQQIYDGTNLFTAGHNNIASSAFDYDALDAVETKMRQQTPFDGADHELGLANAVAYVICVTNIRKDVSQVIMSENRPGENQEGIENEFRQVKRIVLDHLSGSSTTAWITCADPQKTNTGYFGHVEGFETPVLTINDQENQGPRFFEDKTTIKVEDAFAHLIPDFRPWSRGNA